MASSMTMNRVDYLEKELARLLHWIQAADGRVSLILPLSTAMLAALAALAPPPDSWEYIELITSLLAAGLLALSLLFAALASFPRTSGNIPTGSMVFFVGISGRTPSQYRKEAMELSDADYESDLIDQCHINARIANIKFLWVKRSIGGLFLATAPWLVSVFLLYGNS